MDTATKIITVLLIAVGLSMDAFAVSICKGLAMKKITFTMRMFFVAGIRLKKPPMLLLKPYCVISVF